MEKKLYFTPTVEKITVEVSELLGNSNGCQQAAKRCDSGAGENCGSQDSSTVNVQSTFEDVEPSTTNWSIWDEEL